MTEVAKPRSKIYSWSYIASVAGEHKKTLIYAHIIAIFSAIISVPVPLLMPLMVDEVLLDQPGEIVGFMQAVFPEA